MGFLTQEKVQLRPYVHLSPEKSFLYVINWYLLTIIRSVVFSCIVINHTSFKCNNSKKMPHLEVFYQQINIEKKLVQKILFQMDNYWIGALLPKWSLL